jgi:hypothetical protein
MHFEAASTVWMTFVMLQGSGTGKDHCSVCGVFCLGMLYAEGCDTPRGLPTIVHTTPLHIVHTPAQHICSSCCCGRKAAFLSVCSCCSFLMCRHSFASYTNVPWRSYIAAAWQLRHKRYYFMHAHSSPAVDLRGHHQQASRSITNEAQCTGP